MCSTGARGWECGIGPVKVTAIQPQNNRDLNKSVKLSLAPSVIFKIKFKSHLYWHKYNGY